MEQYSYVRLHFLGFCLYVGKILTLNMKQFYLLKWQPDVMNALGSSYFVWIQALMYCCFRVVFLNIHHFLLYYSMIKINPNYHSVFWSNINTKYIWVKGYENSKWKFSLVLNRKISKHINKYRLTWSDPCFST